MRQKKMTAIGSEMALSGPEKPQTILKNSWTRTVTQSFDESNVELYSIHTESPRISPELSPKHDKPQKRVSFRLSDLRRQSLTGSLPDLAKASDQEVKKCSNNLVDLQISRDPLPEGSQAFRAVMDELDTDSEGDSNDPDSDELSHSWSCGNDVQSKNKKLYSALGKTFQSKTAALIYAKTFASSVHKRGKSSCVTSVINGSNQQRTSIDLSKLPNIGLQRENRPCSGHSQESPRTTANKLHSTPSINTRSTSLHRSRSLSGHCPSSAPRLSPLVAGQVTNVLVSADKVGIRRQISEPRLLQRSTQKRRLTKSSSVD